MPEKKPERWGVTVKLAQPWKRQLSKSNLIGYLMHVEKKRPGAKAFFTHKALHEKLKKMKKGILNRVRYIGHGVIGLFPEEERAEIYGFYPFQPNEVKEHQVKRVLKTQEELQGYGVGVHLRKEMVKNLLEEIPDYTIKSHEAKSEEVKSYLEKIGINPDKEYPLEEYLALIESYESLREKTLGHTSSGFKEKEMKNIHSAIKQFEKEFGKGQVVAAYLVGGAKKHALGYRTHKKGYKDVDIFLVTKDNLYKKQWDIAKLSDRLGIEMDIDLGNLPVERITGSKFPEHNDLDHLASHYSIARGIPIYNKEKGRELQKKAFKQMKEEFGGNYDRKIEEIRAYMKKHIKHIW